MTKEKNVENSGIVQVHPAARNGGFRQSADTSSVEMADRNFYFGKRVLVTGGTGTIGQEIVRQLLRRQPEVVRIYSRDESKQYRMEQELGPRRDLRYLLGDVRDLERLRVAMRDIDLVFHCAALKHVKACEYNPFEAVKTNILGTQNVIWASLDAGVQKVILTSSDKAVNPANAMGTSKLMAERLMTASNGIRGRGETVFACVRFGNVVGSRDSVVPLFLQQARSGGPLTITHPAMTRFIMSQEQAVALVLKAALLARGGEVFTLKMHSVRILDLAEAVIEAVGSGPIKIVRLGAKPGEKFHEELLTLEEVERSEILDDMYVTYPATIDRESGHGGARPPRRSYSSRCNGLLDRSAIISFLAELGLVVPDAREEARRVV